ncbi:MAG TPA: YqgE/AlgH family protein [Polyangia bacterium]|nr:YqgE/AlgH family protein [Polyangia bacterium]
MSDSLAPGFLVAAPQLQDPNFARTVVLVLEHDDEDGSLGLVINRPAMVAVEQILEILGLEGEGPGCLGDESTVMYGGPVATEFGWILHTPDWQRESTRAVGEGVCVTANREILEAIVARRGPSRFLFCLGYSGWGPGQLVSELKAGAWITVPFAADLVFDVEADHKWGAALARLGIDPMALAPIVGDA